MIYMITLGGSIPGANLEVHAIQFVSGDTVEETYPELQKRWYGNSLHIDSITPFEYIDGYNIVEGGNSDQVPYLIVYGGYQAGVIDELHSYQVVLANNPLEAKKIAKSQLNHFPPMNHVDEVVNIFDTLGKRFGLNPCDCSFRDNTTTHKFIKLQ